MTVALIQDLFAHVPRSPAAARPAAKPHTFLRTPAKKAPAKTARRAQVHTAGGGSRFLPLSAVPYTGAGFGNMPPAHGLTLFPRQQHAGATYTTDDGSDGGDPSAGSAGDQTNVTPVSTTSDPGGGLLSGLLGDIGIDPGTVASSAGDGTTPVTPGGVVSATSATSTSQSNVAAPDTTYTPSTPSGGGGSPAPSSTSPSTAITPAAGGGSHLLWWILGGVAAVGVIWIAWRMFGHKGAVVAGSTAAKAAAYYGMR